ncbi:Zinc-finger homeodomain protein 1 [Bienertia sinuspersici]
MLDFAKKVGWKIQKVNEELLQQFCQEIGINKKMLKVWMHNNKHLFVKKISDSIIPSDHKTSDSAN